MDAPDRIDLDRLHRALGTVYHSWIFDRGGLPAPERLLLLLQIKLPHIDPASWPARFSWGGIYVNGRAVAGDRPLIAPCKIEYYEPREPLHTWAEKFGKFDPKRHIVFEDEFILVAFKPAKLPSIQAKEQFRFSLRGALEEYFGHAVHMPSRLDLSTAGLVAVSKHPAAHNALQQVFQRSRIEKYYWFEAQGAPDWEVITVDQRIGRDPRHHILRRVVNSGGRPAKTHFKVLQRFGERLLIQAQPVTGRTHQIRVHSSFLGLPLAGDNFYGGPEAKELRLLAQRLRFAHPVEKEEEIDVSVPEGLLPEWVRGFSPCT